MAIEMHVALMKNVCYCCKSLTEIGTRRQMSAELPAIKTHGIPFSGSRVVTGEETGIETDRTKQFFVLEGQKKNNKQETTRFSHCQIETRYNVKHPVVLRRQRTCWPYLLIKLTESNKNQYKLNINCHS